MHVDNSAFRKLRQEGPKFEYSLGYTARHCLNKTKQLILPPTQPVSHRSTNQNQNHHQTTISRKF